MVLISFEGNIGAGKSLACDVLAEVGLKVKKEPTKDWKIGGYDVLKAFYDNPKKYAGAFQTLVLRTRVKQSKNTVHGFVERCVSSDFMFGTIQEELGNMDGIEFAAYKWQWEQAVRDTPTIDAYIYLRTSVDTCMVRITERNRDGEGVISRDYLARLHNHHEKWLTKNDGPKQENILILDGEKDLTDQDNRKEFVAQVKTFMMKVSKASKNKK